MITHGETQGLGDGSLHKREAVDAIETISTKRTRKGVSVRIREAIAGPIIENHFQEVVLPTLRNAFQIQSDRIYVETDERIRKIVADDLSKKLNIDVNKVVAPILEEIVRNAVLHYAKFEPGTSIEILNGTGQRVEVLQRQHYMFPVVLRLMCIRDRNGNPLNIVLNGPAGNGKTSIALSCAKALGIESVLQPFNPQTSKADLLGYMDAGGNYVPSPLYEAFTKGKLFIADEFDAANPAIAVSLNAAVANRTLTFPNLETVQAHPNFRPVFIMNTTGTGADHQYTGRFRQDAATLDRLIQVKVPIDEGLEEALAGIKNTISPKVNMLEGGQFRSNKEILNIIRAVRVAIEELQMKYIVSPRAVIHATAMHAGGFGKNLILDYCVWRGMPNPDMKAIIKRINSKKK